VHFPFNKKLGRFLSGMIFGINKKDLVFVLKRKRNGSVILPST